MASTLIKVEIGAEIKKGTTSVGHGWGSGETMRALEKVGDRWTEGRHQKRLQRDATHSGHSSSQTDSEVWLKNKQTNHRHCSCASTSHTESGVLTHRTGWGEPGLGRAEWSRPGPGLQGAQRAAGVQLTEAAVTRAHAKACGKTFPKMPTMLSAS